MSLQVPERAFEGVRENLYCGGIAHTHSLAQLGQLLRQSADEHVDNLGEQRPITELLAPGALFMKNRGAGVPPDKWVRIDTGTRGTGGELAASRALAAHGASYDDIRAWGGSVTHSSYAEAIDRMRDGHIDAFMNDDILRHPLFVDLTTARDVVLLEMDPDIIAELAEEHGYDPVVVPAGTYQGQDDEVQSFAQHHVFFGHKDLPEEFVYIVTKLVFENKDHLVSAHELFSALDPEVGPTAFPIPLHPGAERYYDEVGALE
jgi:uncharacterized protein